MGYSLLKLFREEVLIKDAQDALDLMSDCDVKGARRLIINDYNIITDFFELKTGFAGEILQKFSTYNVKLAIVGDFTKYSGKSLKAFIFESNKYGQISFVNSVQEATERLIK